MRPIFTIHAGEYLVGSKIEESFPRLRVWIPSSDTGVDLLVTDEKQQKVASLQVKFSKDYLATAKTSAATPDIVSGGWWKLNQNKLAESPADYWVFVLYRLRTRQFDFVVIQPRELMRRYDGLCAKQSTIQTYFVVTSHGHCWETRGLGQPDLRKVSDGTYSNQSRDFTRFLNKWPFAKGVAF